jgi:SAM-dependent methyltransferase
VTIPAGGPTSIRESYDSAAQAYAEHLFTELDRKPLDRHLLNRFAEEMRGRGVVADLGCGPGHVARYLHEQGVEVQGLELSPEMIGVASRLNPGIGFRVGDIERLEIPDRAFGGVVLFYSLVHFETSQLGRVLGEVRRVLVDGGSALVAFHAGDEVARVDELFGVPVSLEFHFFQPSAVIGALHSAGLAVSEQVEREPYEGAEYPSRRCYLFARAV